jgi:hypothetical protein
MLNKYVMLALCITVSAAFIQAEDKYNIPDAKTAGEMHLFVKDLITKHELLMDVRDGAEATDTSGVTWRLNVESAAVDGQPDAQDYRLTWKVTTGQVDSASVGVVFEFKDWSPENFVMVPAAVYDGNRFDIKKLVIRPIGTIQKNGASTCRRPSRR